MKKFLNEDECLKQHVYMLENDLLYRKYYNFLLGSYLGDGYIVLTKNKRCFRFTIYSNRYQYKVIDMCYDCLKYVFPDNKISKYENKKHNVTEIKVFNKYLPILFPQHGFNKKHERDIKLNDIQLKYIDYHMISLGMFYSDGCFYCQDKKYYMYNFTNCSYQIIKIFADCMDNLEIKYRIVKIEKSSKRKSDIYRVVISKSKEVYKLYKIFGEKYYESSCNNGEDIIKNIKYNVLK